MRKIPKLTSPDAGIDVLKETLKVLGCGEVALVRNPSYIYAPLELYPLPPKTAGPLSRIAGIVMDMDGTTTTTEPLCLHSLEWMVRRVTGRLTPEAWPGLDRARDYPHVIGNSTTKHVEYLLTAYRDSFDARACLEAYLKAAAWTLSRGRDAGRKREVLANLPALGLGAALQDPEFRRAAAVGPEENAAPESGAPAPFDSEAVDALAARLAPGLLPSFRTKKLADRVRAAIDVYYARYHRILEDVAEGRGAARAREVLGASGGRLIEPMPAIGIFLAAVKGWLGENLGLFADELIAFVLSKDTEIHESALSGAAERLAALGRYFARHPARVAVVTSSIAYEAAIVLGEVLAILREQIAGWPLAGAKKDALLARFASLETLYDAVITASDSSEIRLKPHRDLYSIALHAIGMTPEDFPAVVGFEDSESGVIAIRAAGVGFSVAVPFADTAGHDLSAAACVLRAQMPEALLVRDCFLDRSVFLDNERGSA